MGSPKRNERSTEVALGFPGRVRVRYTRVTKESILKMHLDQRGELTNGRGDHTARRITGSTAPGTSCHTCRCGCTSRCDCGCATGTEDQGPQAQAALLR